MALLVRVSVWQSGQFANVVDGVLKLDREDTPTQIATIEGTVEGGRLRFELPPDVPYGWGATLTAELADGRLIAPQRIQLASDLDVDAQPRGRAPRLYANDASLIDDTGRRVVVGLSTDFRLFQRLLNGEDIAGTRQQRRAAGSQGPRVLGMCVNIGHFDPRDHPSYYDDLRRFARLLAGDGEYLHFTAGADVQLLPGFDMRAHWERCCDVLADEPNVIVCELVNEYFNNGVDPWRFAKPAHAPLVSVGSFVDGDFPPASWGDISTFHPSRTWKWWFTVAATAQEIRQNPRATGKPVWIGEPMGAAATPRADRASDPALFEKLGASIGIFAAGGVFHSDAGLQAQPWSDVERACAEAFFRGLHR